MSKYNFDTSINRKATSSYRWNVKENELPLDIADMDFEVLPLIKEAIKKRSDQDCYGYTFVPESYFEAYIYWWKTRHQVELKKEWFIFSNSVVGSIDSIFKTLFEKDDQVVMFTPIYNVFFNCISNNNLILKECELILKDNDYQIDWNKLECLLKEPQTKAFLFCNPHNPVGRKFSKEEIERIVNLCKQYDVYLISDEIHADLDYNKERYTSVFATSAVSYEKAILLLSPGKVFNVAGLHSSVVIIPNHELKDNIQNGIYRDDIGEPNYFAIEPVIEADLHGSDYVDELNDYICENKAFLNEFFLKNSLNFKIIGSNYTYLLWIDISKYSNNCEEFTRKLREKVGLVVASGTHYGKSGEGFIRLNIATPRKNIEDACDRLKRFIELIGEK